jgi:hypothetical protein
VSTDEISGVLRVSCLHLSIYTGSLVRESEMAFAAF